MAASKPLELRWNERTATQQLMMVAAVLVIVSVLVFIAYWLLRPNYQALFANLRPQDAATIASELERQKVPFRVADGGATIMVPEREVHAARLKVMSRDLPLKGSVGFELFNNADLGLTEFAQKVNYQRALQGELARTIMSLNEVESARVHLSLPEPGLFRRSGAKPRASVALATKSGLELPPDAVRGIQRLVAAAVPELDAHEVTIIDPRGAPMASAGGQGGVVSDRKLELKIELEQYYARKVLKQIETIVGAGNASVSVDAALNFDQIRITQETTGGVAARRKVEGKPSRPLELPVAAEGSADSGTAPRERALAPGFADGATRRLEQIVATPGNVQRLSIAVLIAVPLEPTAMEQVRQMIIATAGLSAERGDVVSFFAKERFTQSPGSADAALERAGTQRDAAAVAGRGASGEDASTRSEVVWVAIAILAAVMIGAVLLLISSRANRTRPLTAAERAARLEQLRRALGEESKVNA